MPASLSDAMTQYANGGAQEVNASAIGTIGPYVTTLTSPTPAVQQYNAAPSVSSQSGLSAFTHFLGGMASGVGHLTADAAKWVATNVKNMATAIPREVVGIAHGQIDNAYLNDYTQRSNQNGMQLQQLAHQFRTGKISKADYQLGLKELIADNNRIGSELQGLTGRINLDKQDSYKAMIDSASTVVTILSAGVGELGLMPAQLAERGAADYLASTNANAMLTNVEAGLNRFATDPAAFGRLSSSAQLALQKATAEVIAQAAPGMTAGEIARASAVNLALKYPFYYNYLSGTGNQIYEELASGKHGAAATTLGFNALMMLSGGPVGYVLQKGGAVVRGLAHATFDHTPFIDALGKGFKDGGPDAIYNHITQHQDYGQYKFFQDGKIISLPTEAARARLVQNLKLLESTNMTKIVGKDPEAAAIRVLTGMSAYEGISMRDMTTEEAMLNLNNYAEAARVAAHYGPPGTVIGRVAPYDIQKIIKEVSPKIGAKPQAAHDALDALAANSGNRAWANNDNFMRQAHSLIDKYKTSKKYEAAMKNIEAQSPIKGMPRGINKTLSDMGYIPITPQRLEAPIKEGASDIKLESKFAQPGGDDFFKHAVRPLPVLGHVGGLLTSMGVSPMGTEQKVYSMYNAALSERLGTVSGLKATKLVGETSEHTADNVVKTLTNWTLKLNKGEVQRGGLHLAGHSIRPPVTDLKQLTTKDIEAALGVSRETANQMAHALRDSMLDVPLAIRGLGDRTVDVLNNIPLFRSYIRLQGAGRFAWNPVFQGKLATKTEAASQALAGGKVPVVLENILGRGPQVEATRELLRSEGIFELAPATRHEIAAGSEAEMSGTAVGANLMHKLLPIQEKSIAGMVMKQSAKVHMTPAQFVQQFPHEVRDTVQLIAHYDRNSAFLHSPLARTLNFAIFPFRFEAKVLGIMVKSLAQTDTLTQIAVINGLMNAHDFLNTPEGMAWYSQNATVLKFLSYFTPTTTLATFGQTLSGLSHEDWRTTVGAWELGGLPLGWLPQILNNEGVNLSLGYVDPTNGVPIPKQVPNSAKAQLQTAVGDFIGSLFTYPGSEVGLPSKTKIDKFIGGAFIGGQAKSTEFTPTQQPLNQQQQTFSSTIQAQQQTKNDVKGTTQGTLPTPQPTTIQLTGSGTAAPKYTAAELKALSKTAKAPKLKKGQFKATLPS